MTGEIHPHAAIGFARAAAEYERARPSYAPEAVDWITQEVPLEPGATVVDLGAGTGKLTRLLAATGARVIAVEPVAPMRETLSRLLPEVEALEGRAEAIPLPEACADAVTAAQAFHWFGDEAPAEIHRVLRRDGALFLIWNVRDTDDPLQARLQELNDRYLRPEFDDCVWGRSVKSSELFGPVEERAFRHVHRLDRDGLVARAASISFVAAMDEAARERVLDEVRQIYADFAPNPDAELELPYRTLVFLTRAL